MSKLAPAESVSESSASTGLAGLLSKECSSLAGEESKKLAYEVSSTYKPSPRHDLAMLFTCVKCNVRSAKTFSKESYETGVVIVRCGGCQNLHLISDRLGMFGEKGSVEDFLRDKGEVVKRASEGTYEFKLEDLMGKKAE